MSLDMDLNKQEAHGGLNRSTAKTLCKFGKNKMETVYLIAQTRRIFSNSRGDYCVLISPILLIFNRVQVLIDIKILCKFGNNWMKTVELIA